MYFKFFKPQDRWKRFVVLRRGLIQSFHSISKRRFFKGGSGMPPKPKFTRDEIVSAALALVRERGESALTAREVGKALGVSSSPIFTTFRDMDELKAAVR